VEFKEVNGPKVLVVGMLAVMDVMEVGREVIDVVLVADPAGMGTRATWMQPAGPVKKTNSIV